MNGTENKENQPFTSINTRAVYANDKQSRKAPSIVLSQDSDSDSDSDGNINWKDYYGDDEQGLCPVIDLHTIQVQSIY